MASATIPFLAPDEYLKLERAAAWKSEYINGQMYAMAGGSKNHVRIVRNVLRALDTQLEGTSCEAFSSDYQLHSAKYDFYTYPDVVVACSTPDVPDEDQDILTDATLIVEVLSSSTKNFDRAEKFQYYRSLPSFSEYLLIHQERVYAEHFTRQPDGSWLFQEYTASDTRISLASIHCTLELSVIYRLVRFRA